MDTSKLRLHEQLIRLAKGMLKAWEDWIMEQKAKM
jgi:hypothetical protein